MTGSLALALYTQSCGYLQEPPLWPLRFPEIPVNHFLFSPAQMARAWSWLALEPWTQAGRESLCRE